MKKNDSKKTKKICCCCLYWSIHEHHNTDKRKWGDCYCPKMYSGYGVSPEDEDIEDDAMITENDEGWGFIVGPDFGCIHFKERIK